MELSFSLHVIGIVLWLGGTLILTKLVRWSLQNESLSESTQAFALKLYRFYIIPGMLIVLGTGLVQLFGRGASFYMQQGWFHGKLTLVIVFVVSTAILGMDLKTPARLTAGRALTHHAVAGTVLLGAVFLTMFGRMYQ